jgi:toxin ParE1/3/4
MMPLPVEFHSEAVDEAAAVRRWYSAIDAALGAAFAGELNLAIDRIAAAPDRFAKHLHGTRGYLLNRFPYLVVYRHADGRVQIIAVQHTKRRPGHWRARMKT